MHQYGSTSYSHIRVDSTTIVFGKATDSQPHNPTNKSSSIPAIFASLPSRLKPARLGSRPSRRQWRSLIFTISPHHVPCSLTGHSRNLASSLVCHVWTVGNGLAGFFWFFPPLNQPWSLSGLFAPRLPLQARPRVPAKDMLVTATVSQSCNFAYAAVQPCLSLNQAKLLKPTDIRTWHFVITTSIPMVQGCIITGSLFFFFQKTSM